MRYFLWLLLAWPTPALIAGALGWKGVWGSGSALTDYLIPIPVAGGAFHAMTVLGFTVLLATQARWPALPRGLARGLLLGLSLCGIAVLLDLQAIHRAMTSDAVLRIRWEQNPVGLFLLTDSLIAQLFVGAFEGRSPENGREWALSLLLAVLLPAAAAHSLVTQHPTYGKTFIHKGSHAGPQRGDEQVIVYTTLSVVAPTFRQQAENLAQQWHPARNMNSEDTAVHFFTSLQAAEVQDKTQAAMTYCMYEDGTPPEWQLGAGDCFSRHENFTERLMRFIDAQDRQLPMDERVRLARRQACEGLALPPDPMGDLAVTQSCKANR
jgi:hypothetical protein